MRKVVKFQLSELLGIGMTFVVLGIALGYGIEIVGDTQDDMCGEGLEHELSGNCYSCLNSTSNTFDAANLVCSNHTYGANGSAVLSGTADYNATHSTINGISTIPEKLPTIATIVVAAVILGVLVTYLWARFR